MGMRRTHTVIASVALSISASVLAFLATAATVVPPLPPSDYADTEVSTNVVIGRDQRVPGEFGFRMDFVACPSNNVQVAFGTDEDGDGVLSVEETGFAFAWDCGAWQVSSTPSGPRLLELAATTNAEKSVVWRVRLRRSVPRGLAASENGAGIFRELSADPPPWLYGRRWNLMRITVRGVDRADERILVRFFFDGTRIILR